MKMAWGARVSPEFRDRVVRIAAEHSIDPSWLMAAMAFETGGTFDPAKRNPLSTATGLIQFMASTARELNTSTEALAAMSAVEQLDYVARYFRPFVGRLKTLSDVYMAILWPAAVGRPEESPLFALGSPAYDANKSLDVNVDGVVTKGEATAFVARRLEEGLRPGNVFDMDTQPAAPIEDRPIQEPAMAAPLMFVLPLLQSLFQVFTPLAQSKISAALNKETKDQAMSDQMAQQILDIVKNAASQATGGALATTPTPGASATPPPPVVAPTAGLPPAAAQIVQQAAEIEEIRRAIETVKADAALAAKAEADVVSYLKSLEPFIDRMAELDKMEWAASEESMDRAAVRYAQNPNPDDWMTKTLVIGALGLGASLIALVAGVAIAQVVGSPAREPSTVVWASLTGIIGTVFGIVTTIYAFRFGTTRQSAAKDFTNAAMAGELAVRNPRRAR